MEERSHAQSHFLSVMSIRNPATCLQRVCQQVAVCEHRTFRKSCRSSCILKDGEVTTSCLHRQIEYLYTTFRVGLQHSTHGVQRLVLVKFLLVQTGLRMFGTKLSNRVESS